MVPAMGQTGPGKHDASAGSPVSPSHKGVVVDVDPPATVSGFKHRPGLAYLPPAYFRAGADLPLLMLLTGTPGTPINWLRAGGAEATADAYAAAHNGVAPILVFASLFTAHEFDLVFPTIQVIALAAAVTITALIAADGESNWLEGAQLMAVYVIVATAFWYL